MHNKVRKTNRSGATPSGSNACLSRFGVAGNRTDRNDEQAGVQGGFSQGIAQTSTGVNEVAQHHQTLCIMTHHSKKVSEWEEKVLKRAIL